MRTLNACLCVLFCLAVLPAPQSAAASETERPGYTCSLFDGRTLHGWTVENDCEADVHDGMLRLKAGNGWLRSHHTYGDFRLHVEWKALKKENYDAGIYLRAGREGSPFPERGYQANLLQGREGHINNLDGAKADGLVKPAGQWNTFDITAVGETVSLRINGKPAYTVNGATIPRGYIGLQVEVPKGGQFLVRNVRVTELDNRSLFNGQDLAGWEGAGGNAETCWTVRDGAITCTGGQGPWLRSREQFGDFNLRLEYKVAPGGNSGIYVRVPPNGDHHRWKQNGSPAGFEVQILDDSARKFGRLKDYQFCCSLYKLVGPRRRVGNPPGEWNTLELNAEGQHITVVHNGVTVIDATPGEIPLLLLRNPKGHLGFQNHKTEVQYRRIRIGDAVSAYSSQP